MKKTIYLGFAIFALAFSLTAFSSENVSTLNCIKCHGRGTIDVKVDCPRCLGNKKDKWGDDCPQCDGKGYVIKQETCPKCGGDGQQKEPVQFPESQKKY